MTFESLLELFAQALARALAPILAPLIAPLLGGSSTPDPCLTIPQAARRTGLPLTTLYRIVKAGKIETIPGLEPLRIKQSVCDAWRGYSK